MCGNGITEEGEECDAGGENDTNAPCTPDCTINVCGDGFPFTDNLEECDDGNQSDTDGCLSDCTLAVCGDGVVYEGVEECDAGAETSDACTSNCLEQYVTDIVAGESHTCALLRDGALRCWGQGAYGRLGLASLANVGDDEHPYQAGNVQLGGPVVALSAGFWHTCAIIEGGDLRCWGDNEQEQLGLPGVDIVGDDEVPEVMPVVEVGGVVTDVAAGYTHTCVLLDTEKVRCWGTASVGQLGYGNTDIIGDDEVPASAGDVVVGYPVTDVEVGYRRSCAILRNSGLVRCWGTGNMGYGFPVTIGDDEVPAAAGDLELGGVAMSVSLSFDHNCAVLATGALQCWGNAFYSGYSGLNGTLGDQEHPADYGPVDVGGTVVQVATGGSHTCVVLEDGAVKCFGQGSRGRLGYGSEQSIGDNEPPASVGSVSIGGEAVKVVAGYAHTCVLLDNHDVRCWGDAAHGRLGLVSPYDVGDDELPTDVDVVQVLAPR